MKRQDNDPRPIAHEPKRPYNYPRGSAGDLSLRRENRFHLVEKLLVNLVESNRVEAEAIAELKRIVEELREG